MNKVTLAVSFMTLFIAGCAGHSGCVRQDSGTGDFRRQGELIVQAVVEGDFRKFQQAANEPETIGDAGKFAESRKNMIAQFGTPEKFHHLTDLKTPLLVNQLWVIDFTRKDRDGRKICQQQMLQLLFGEKDEQKQLLGMRFL